jgi:hypothetical protein
MVMVVQLFLTVARLEKLVRVQEARASRSRASISRDSRSVGAAKTAVNCRMAAAIAAEKRMMIVDGRVKEVILDRQLVNESDNPFQTKDCED